MCCLNSSTNSSASLKSTKSSGKSLLIPNTQAKNLGNFLSTPLNFPTAIGLTTLDTLFKFLSMALRHILQPSLNRYDTKIISRRNFV